jgi:predicted patatin/cPLA2 family phospholipase
VVPAHEVLRVLAARAGTGGPPYGDGKGTGGRPYGDGLRVALAIEGGGMRGVISAGMALELHERGLVPAFDAVYGASAGAITGAWLLSSRPEGLLGWTETAYAKTLIRRSGLLRGRPAVDVRSLIEELYQTTFPMDFASVLASPVEYHPLATDVTTGSSTDLRPFISDPAELRLALRASAAMPLLAGPPVEFAGRRFYDAGVSESIPYRTALAQGATHVLVLRSRRDPLTWPDGRAPSRSVRVITRTTLRRETPALRATFLDRDARLAADDRRLAAYQSASDGTAPASDGTAPASDGTAPASDGTAPASDADAPMSAQPAVFSIRPAADSPEVSRLATDGKLLRAAFEAGRAATRAAFA